MIARLSTMALVILLAAPAGAQDRVIVLADPSDEALLRALRIELTPAGLLVVPLEAPRGPTERARLEEVRLRAEEHEAVAAVWMEPIGDALRVRVLWIGRGVSEAEVDGEARGRVLALVAASLLDEVRSADVLDLVVPAEPPRALADPVAPRPEPPPPPRSEDPPAPRSILPRVTPILQLGGGLGGTRDGLGYRGHAAVGLSIEPGLRFAAAAVLTGAPSHYAPQGDVLEWPRSYTAGLEVSFRPDVRPFAFQLGFQARVGYGEGRDRDRGPLLGRLAHAIGLHLAAGVVLDPKLDLLLRFDGEVHGLQDLGTGGVGMLSLAMEVH